MASYAIEVLVIYIFNNYSHLFTSEIQAFFSFFHILGEMDWDKEILHIFGTIKIESFAESLNIINEMDPNVEIDPFWYIEYESIKEIEVGGASYNFCVQTKNKRYFLKLLPDNERFQKTKALCKMLKILHPTKYEDFKQYKMLIMSYFDGHKVYYDDCNPVFLTFVCFFFE